MHFIFLFVAISFVIKAQMLNLYEMSQGRLKYSKILFDNNSLWGYFYLYELDITKDSAKMEYIVLDKNLNRLYNGTFNAIKYKDQFLSSYYTKYENCILMGKDLVLDISLLKGSASSGYSLVHNSNRIIDLQEGKVSEEYIYRYYEKKFIPVPATALSYSNRNDSLGNRIFVDPIHGGGERGFLIRRVGGLSVSRNQSDVRFYSADREFKWQYNFDSVPGNRAKYSKIKKRKTIDYLFMDSLRLYFLERTYDNYDKELMYQLITLDINTGMKTSEYCIQTDTSQYYHNLNFKQLGDTIVIYGRHYHNPKLKKGSYYNGCYRIFVDQNCREIDKDYNTWADVSTPEIKILNKLKIDKTRNVLALNTMLIFGDGSMAMVSRALHRQSTVASLLYGFTLGIINLDASYYKDLYFININKNFEPTGITTAPMNKSTLSDNYLFSQYHANNMAAVVCYKNSIKSVNNYETELVINTIKNNEVMTERIPLTSANKYVILPNPAKDGYIMLNEFNEKDKYNQIRLERLNN